MGEGFPITRSVVGFGWQCLDGHTYKCSDGSVWMGIHISIWMGLLSVLTKHVF